MQEIEESLEIVERVATLDIGKEMLTACIRVPHEDKPGRRLQEVREYPTTTRSLLELSDRLRCQGVTLVAMEATSDYWKPVFYLLEAEGFECWLLNAKHVKNVPGRPKTDKLDAVWLAKVVERGMCRPSFVPPKPIRQLRDLTRYRRTLVRERSSEKQRLEKILEDAQIKLTSVISDLFTLSGREMLQAMIDGERSPKTQDRASPHAHELMKSGYRRVAKRRGKRRALVAVGNSVLTIAWHLLSDPDARFSDLGPGFYESRHNKDRQTRNLMRQLEQLTGRHVVLADAMA